MHSTYRDLIDLIGVETLLQVDDNYYQGDSRVLVRDHLRYGLLLFGWGSCSGCDAVQAAGDDPVELANLRDTLRRSIHWEDSAAGPPWPNRRQGLVAGRQRRRRGVPRVPGTGAADSA